MRLINHLSRQEQRICADRAVQWLIKCAHVLQTAPSGPRPNTLTHRIQRLRLFGLALKPVLHLNRQCRLIGHTSHFTVPADFADAGRVLA